MTKERDSYADYLEVKRRLESRAKGEYALCVVSRQAMAGYCLHARDDEFLAQTHYEETMRLFNMEELEDLKNADGYKTDVLKNLEKVLGPLLIALANEPGRSQSVSKAYAGRVKFVYATEIFEAWVAKELSQLKAINDINDQG